MPGSVESGSVQTMATRSPERANAAARFEATKPAAGPGTRAADEQRVRGRRAAAATGAGGEAQDVAQEAELAAQSGGRVGDAGALAPGADLHEHRDVGPLGHVRAGVDARVQAGDDQRAGQAEQQADDQAADQEERLVRLGRRGRPAGRRQDRTGVDLHGLHRVSRARSCVCWVFSTSRSCCCWRTAGFRACSARPPWP